MIRGEKMGRESWMWSDSSKKNWDGFINQVGAM
jgi:hypothetical protein